MRRLPVLFLVASLSLVALPARAAPALLDPAFGGDGIVTAFPDGAIATVPVLPMTSVYPSGGLFASWRVPMPPAPGRFSTMICWPNVRLIVSARMRAITSLPPPGACGTISVIGRAG